MKRNIIEIDEAKCNGCGLCIPNCPEGAIQVIGGKARLLGDLFCDGLGACIGECPAGAIRILEREAAPYNEEAVMENIIRQGDAVISAHLDHLLSHGETDHYDTALRVLEKKGLSAPSPSAEGKTAHNGGCPGARPLAWDGRPSAGASTQPQPSRLSTWPIQLHLLPPRAPYLEGRDLLLCADCVSYAVGDFHERHLKDGVLAIACPKLDDGQEIYLEKLAAVLADAGVRSLTVLTMEVPCCAGLARLAAEAFERAGRPSLPAVWKVIDLKGEEIRRTGL